MPSYLRAASRREAGHWLFPCCATRGAWRPSGGAHDVLPPAPMRLASA